MCSFSAASGVTFFFNPLAGMGKNIAEAPMLRHVEICRRTQAGNNISQESAVRHYCCAREEGFKYGRRTKKKSVGAEKKKKYIKDPRAGGEESTKCLAPSLLRTSRTSALHSNKLGTQAPYPPPPGSNGILHIENTRAQKSPSGLRPSNDRRQGAKTSFFPRVTDAFLA